uniref:Uncharacterized protein n=2 Tax=Strongyloides stercoralis TaxID=6248 RepID=A0AAF5I2P8_STRER
MQVRSKRQLSVGATGHLAHRLYKEGLQNQKEPTTQSGMAPGRYSLNGRNPTKWDLCLKSTEFSINTSTCSNKDYSFFFLIYDRKPMLPISLVMSKIPYAIIYNVPTFAQLTEKIKKIREDIHEMRINKKLSKKLTKSGYVDLNVEDTVLKLIPNKPKISSKLAQFK